MKQVILLSFVKMKMSYLCVMTFWFCLAESIKLYKKHVYNSVLPPPIEQVYNISSWVRQLHLQQCVLVEIGEKYCGVFIEYRSLKLRINAEIQEYFLGLCDADTLRKWKFCPPALEKERPKECIFQERTEFSNNPARVHRRLCEVTDLAFNGDICDCSGLFAGQKLHKVTGFPTCFLTPLPDSLCTPRNVCGISSCNASTLGRQIHIVQCNPKCIGGQPFCESTGPETTQASEIDSYWSDWNELSCDGQLQNCTSDFLYSEALCINQNTGMGAIDCLGPGTNCCPANSEMCKCYIYTEDGVLKLFRQFKSRRSMYDDPDRIPFFERLLYRQHRADNKNIQRSKSLAHSRHHGWPKRVEEEYEDDDENVEDSNDEDIVLDEEDEDKTHVTTTELAERSEIKQHVPYSDPEKPAVEEIAKDVTDQDDEESNAFMLRPYIFCYKLCLCVSLLIQFPL